MSLDGGNPIADLDLAPRRPVRARGARVASLDRNGDGGRRSRGCVPSRDARCDRDPGRDRIVGRQRRRARCGDVTAAFQAARAGDRPTSPWALQQPAFSVTPVASTLGAGRCLSTAPWSRRSSTAGRCVIDASSVGRGCAFMPVDRRPLRHPDQRRDQRLSSRPTPARRRAGGVRMVVTALDVTTRSAGYQAIARRWRWVRDGRPRSARVAGDAVPRRRPRTRTRRRWTTSGRQRRPP